MLTSISCGAKKIICPLINFPIHFSIWEHVLFCPSVRQRPLQSPFSFRAGINYNHDSVPRFRLGFLVLLRRRTHSDSRTDAHTNTRCSTIHAQARHPCFDFRCAINPLRNVLSVYSTHLCICSSPTYM